MLRLLALPLAAAAALALAGPVSANTYCVVAPGCSGTPAGDVQAGLGAAQQHAGADTVKIGPGTFTADAQGFHYDDPAVGNAVTIAGAGPGKTTLTTSSHDSTSVLRLTAGSLGQDLHIAVPGGLFMYGLSLAGATGRNITVDGDASAGAVLSGAATLRGSQIAGNVAIDVYDGGSTVLNTVAAGRGIGVRVFGDSTFTRLQRMRVDASDGGGQPAAIGVQVNCGRVALEDSVVYVRNAQPEGIGVDATSSPCSQGRINGVELRESTLLGAGAGSRGVVAVSSDATQASAVNVTNSIVRGFQHSLDREALGGIAFMQTTASSYPSKGDIDATLSGGTGNLIETAHTTGDPKFVNEAGGDYRLAAGSPLIDGGSGDPLAPGESNLDKAGLPRIVDGNADGIARRDVGAFEFKP
jgi:hypothetical protein